MPFQSEKQRRYLHANHPEIAKRWEKEYAHGGILDITGDEEITTEEGNDISLVDESETGVSTLFMKKVVKPLVVERSKVNLEEIEQVLEIHMEVEDNMVEVLVVDLIKEVMIKVIKDLMRDGRMFKLFKSLIKLQLMKTINLVLLVKTFKII